MAPPEGSVGVAVHPEDHQHKDHHAFLTLQLDSSLPSTSSCPYLSSQSPTRQCPRQQAQKEGQPQQASFTGARTDGVFQAWKLQRPVMQQCPRLTRQQLRRKGLEGWTMQEVAQHRFPDDGWVVIDGAVYDITEHVVHHPGWDTGCGISTVISILAALGTDATFDFKAIHPPWSPAWKQLKPFYIGDLRSSTAASAS